MESSLYKLSAQNYGRHPNPQNKLCALYKCQLIFMANVPKINFPLEDFKGKIYVKKLGTYLKMTDTRSANQLSTWFILTDFSPRWSELSLVYYMIFSKCNDFLENNELLTFY